MRSLLLSLVYCISISVAFAQEKPINSLNIADPAPDFNLPGTDGKNYSLASFDSYKYLAVIFTCNHCPTAQAYEDKIIKLVKQYRAKGVGFVAISPNDPKAVSLSELGYSDLNDDLEDMKTRAQDKGFNFPYLYDGETQEVSLKYGPYATPQVFLFDEHRKLSYRGRIDDTEDPYKEPKKKDLILAMDQMLAGQPIEVTETKTFGCSVKWSWKDEWTKVLLKKWSEEPVSLENANLEDITDLLSNSGNKLRLINLWATWCGPCLIEFPELVNTNRMYRDRDFEFISISTDKLNKKEKALSMLTNMEASNSNLIFSGDDIYELIEVIDKDWKGSLPYTLLVAPGGEYIYAHEGIIEPNKLRKKIVSFIGRYYAND